MSLSGSVVVNGVPRTLSSHRQGYVTQEDVFYSALTVRETLMMAAELRLPRGTPREEISQYVEALIAALGESLSSYITTLQ
jgi:ABC-type multidrug transport system ATPase subunit